MARNSYTRYVHIYTEPDEIPALVQRDGARRGEVVVPAQPNPNAGRIWHVVAQWVEQANRYQWPLDAETVRLTGCHTGFGGLSDAPRYATRKAALVAARRMFGESA